MSVIEKTIIGVALFGNSNIQKIIGGKVNVRVKTANNELLSASSHQDIVRNKRRNDLFAPIFMFNEKTDLRLAMTDTHD